MLNQKYWVVYLAVMLLPTAVYAQGAAVMLEKMKVLYLCTTNPIFVAVENVPSSNLIVTTDNGRVEPNEYSKKAITTFILPQLIP